MFTRFHRWLVTPPRPLPDDVLEFYAVTNWTVMLGLFGHIALLGSFFVAGVPTLGWLNVASVATFALAVVMARRGRLTTAMGLGSVEVVVHAIAATVVLGWDTAFFAYVLLVVVLWILFTGRSLSQRLRIAAGCAVVLIALGVATREATPWTELSPTVLSAMMAFNLGLVCVVLMGICAYYVWTVRHLQTVRDQAQLELRQAIGRAATIVDTMADGMVDLGPDGAVRSINPAMERLLWEVEGDDPLPPELRALATAALETGEKTQGTVALPDGRTGEAVVSPLGALLGAVVMVRVAT